MRRAKSGLGSGRSSRPIAGRPVSAPPPLPAAPEPAPIMPAYAVTAAAPQRVGPGGRYLATTGVRVVGYVVDSFLLSMAMALAWQVISPALGDDGGSGLDWQWAIVALNVVVDGGYFILLWSGGRRTLGMRLFRIEVVRAGDGAAVSIPVAAVRWAVLFIPGLVIGFVDLGPVNDAAGFAASILIGWAWTIVLLASVILSPTRQGIHDRVARTSVVTR